MMHKMKKAIGSAYIQGLEELIREKDEQIVQLTKQLAKSKKQLVKSHEILYRFTGCSRGCGGCGFSYDCSSIPAKGYHMAHGSVEPDKDFPREQARVFGQDRGGGGGPCFPSVGEESAKKPDNEE